MLETIIGNLIASILVYVLISLPFYFFFKKRQKDDLKRTTASIYFKTATIALILHLGSLPFHDTILVHTTSNLVFISVFYWLHVIYLFICFNILTNKDTQKEDNQ